MAASSTAESAARCQATFRRYLELRKGLARELIVKKAGSFAVEAYKATKAVAPSPGKIKQDVTSRGWRVRRKPGAWPRRRGEKRGSKGPLKRMQAAQVKRRVRAIGSVASGFIPAMTALGSKVGAKDTGKFKNPRGSVVVSSSAIGIVNSTPGIVAVEKKHHIIKTALDAVTRDMETYINRKLQETARNL